MADLAQNLQQDAICEIQELMRPKFKRPFVSVMINKKPIKGLYDTGADVSCLDEKVFRQIPLEDRPLKLKESTRNAYKAASGNLLQVRGRYKIPIQVGTKT